VEESYIQWCYFRRKRKNLLTTLQKYFTKEISNQIFDTIMCNTNINGNVNVTVNVNVITNQMLLLTP